MFTVIYNFRQIAQKHYLAVRRIIGNVYRTAHKFYLTAYRITGMFALSAIISLAVGYILLAVYFTGSRSWALPVVLGPTQENVLAHASTTMTLRSAQTLHAADRTGLIAQLAGLTEQITRLSEIEEKYRPAQDMSAVLLERSAQQLAESADARSRLRAPDMRQLDSSTEAELKAGIITKEVAMSRAVQRHGVDVSSVQLNAEVDAARLEASRQRAQAVSLRGGRGGVEGLAPVVQREQLAALLAQARIDSAKTKARITALDKILADGASLVETASAAPSFQAINKEVQVMFIPYANASNAIEGEEAYACRWIVARCRPVGKIGKLTPAETYSEHPVFKSRVKGQYLTVDFTERVNDDVVFLGGGPWFFGFAGLVLTLVVIGVNRKKLIKK